MIRVNDSQARKSINWGYLLNSGISVTVPEGKLVEHNLQNEPGLRFLFLFVHTGTRLGSEKSNVWFRASFELALLRPFPYDDQPPAALVEGFDEQIHSFVGNQL